MTLTCGDCRLIQDCNVREMTHPACERIEKWDEDDTRGILFPKDFIQKTIPITHRVIMSTKEQ